MIRSLLMASGFVLATGALPAVAQDYQVRDCRADTAVTLPMIATGHDAITAHATDELLGPSIFQRFSTTENDIDFSIETRRFETREDQIAAYLSCDVPFMRVTHAEMSMLAEYTGQLDATRMQPVFFFGWSNGADAVVARDASSLEALSGAKIATDAARLDLALQLAADAGTAPDIALVEDPAAHFANTPDAMFSIVPTPQANVLTAGNVGTGAEGSVNGARQVITTTSANRVIGDLLVVRKDFMEQSPERVRATVRAYLKAEELFREDAKKQIVDFARAAEMVLGDPALEDEMKTLWSGVETVGLSGQTAWADSQSARSFRNLVNSGQNRMVDTGLLSAAVALDWPDLDFVSLGDDLWDKRRVQTSSFDRDAATEAIKAMSNEEIDDSTIAEVTILFKPNQASFPISEYRSAFETALEKSQVYAGGVLSIEAHSSYLGYLKGVLKQGWEPPRQKREVASLRNTSTARALAVREALVQTANEMGFAIDESQITVNGRGIEDPLGGFCNDLPCPPKTEKEWRESRRVVFRVIGMESEAEVFTPLNDW